MIIKRLKSRDSVMMAPRSTRLRCGLPIWLYNMHPNIIPSICGASLNQGMLLPGCASSLPLYPFNHSWLPYLPCVSVRDPGPLRIDSYTSQIKLPFSLSWPRIFQWGQFCWIRQTLLLILSCVGGWTGKDQKSRLRSSNLTMETTGTCNVLEMRWRRRDETVWRI